MTVQRDALVFQIARTQKLIDQNMNGYMKEPYTSDIKTCYEFVRVVKVRSTFS